MIIEAVPNFSEGRRPEVVNAIVDSIAIDGVVVLGVTSDYDHNRSVVTVAGAPDAVLEGLFRGVETAATQIDLFTHQGEHPRLGATDVVPLVPVEACSLEQCAELAAGWASGSATNWRCLSISMKPRPRVRSVGNLTDVRRG